MNNKIPKGYVIDLKGNIFPFGQVYLKGDFKYDLAEASHAISFYTDVLTNEKFDQKSLNMKLKNPVNFYNDISKMALKGLIFIFDWSAEKYNENMMIYCSQNINLVQLNKLKELLFLYSDYDEQRVNLLPDENPISIEKFLQTMENKLGNDEMDLKVG